MSALEKDPIERVLNEHERRFCAENKIDHDMALGKQFDDSPIKRTDPFWIEGRFTDGPIIKQIDALVIVDKARFANAIIKLANAYNLAIRYQVSAIYHPGFDFLADDFQVGDLKITAGLPSSKNILKSGFFYNKSLYGLSPPTLSKYRIIRVFASHLKLALPGKQPTQNNELFVHIRSGDIFKENPPHYLYGQPPLSFYKKIIKLEKWNRINLVYEDDLNPVIKRLIEFVRSVNIPLRIHSGSLIEDVEVLCRAKNLIIGRGHFIYPVLCLSKNIERVFCFEADLRNHWQMDQADIRFLTVIDKLGRYKNDVLTYWRNSVEQRNLMLTYSEDNLFFE